MEFLQIPPLSINAGRSTPLTALLSVRMGLLSHVLFIFQLSAFTVRLCLRGREVYLVILPGSPMPNWLSSIRVLVIPVFWRAHGNQCSFRLSLIFNQDSGARELNGAYKHLTTSVKIFKNGGSRVRFVRSSPRIPLISCISCKILLLTTSQLSFKLCIMGKSLR